MDATQECGSEVECKAVKGGFYLYRSQDFLSLRFSHSAQQGIIQPKHLHAKLGYKMSPRRRGNNLREGCNDFLLPSYTDFLQLRCPSFRHAATDDPLRVRGGKRYRADCFAKYPHRPCSVSRNSRIPKIASTTSLSPGASAQLHA